jgi:3-isopropylmalate/(R)-2-methylmalate dehydratase small subunit
VRLATDDPSTAIRVDLPAQTVDAADVAATFDIDPHTKHLLVEGLDGIALTLAHADDISAFEASRPSWLPRASA